MTETEAKRKAQAMLDQIRDGKTVFTRAHDEWMIVGPTADIVKGAIVTATRANGATSTVRVVGTYTTSAVQGVSYTVATFRNVTIVETPATPEVAADSFKTTEHAFFGSGRRYASQRGATQYDDGSGRYATQIWDNA